MRAQEHPPRYNTTRNMLAAAGGASTARNPGLSVLIVASGPSSRSVSASLIGKTSAMIVAVNGAIDWLPRADVFFTLDPSPANQERMMNRREGTSYVCAAPPDLCYLSPVVTRLERRYDPGRVLGILPTLSEDPGTINTGNSAWGALGLAYHLRPGLIVLLGVDGTQEERREGGKPRSLVHLPDLFASAVPQLEREGIEVINGSPDSLVTCFPRMSPTEALSYIETRKGPGDRLPGLEVQ